MNHEGNEVLLTNEVMSKHVTRHLVQYFYTGLVAKIASELAHFQSPNAYLGIFKFSSDLLVKHV